MADILIWPALAISVVAIVFSFSAYARVTKIGKKNDPLDLVESLDDFKPKE